MLPTKFRFIWPSGFRGEFFLEIDPIRDKNCLWWPCLLTDRDKMCNLYRGHSIDASYQVSVHLPKGFQGRRLKCEQLTDNRPKWWQKLTLPKKGFNIFLSFLELSTCLQFQHFLDLSLSLQGWQFFPWTSPHSGRGYKITFLWFQL